MLLAIVDLETAKHISEEQAPVEVGIVAYDTDTRTIVGTFSTLLYADTVDAVTVHRIPDEAVKSWGVELGSVGKIPIQEILSLTNIWWVKDIDYLVAHNAEFEQSFIDGGDIPWLCTYKDFDLFPSGYEGKRDLISLAQWYGVGVSISHRAIYDCLLIAEIFNRVPDLKKEIEYALLPIVEWLAPKDAEHTPDGFRWDYSAQGWIGKQSKSTIGSFFAPVGERVEVIAEVDFHEKDFAKSWGFRWEPEQRQWQRLANPDSISAFPFPVRFAKPLAGTLKIDDYDYSQNPLIEDRIYGSSS